MTTIATIFITATKNTLSTNSNISNNNKTKLLLTLTDVIFFTDILSLECNHKLQMNKIESIISD